MLNYTVFGPQLQTEASCPEAEISLKYCIKSFQLNQCDLLKCLFLWMRETQLINILGLIVQLLHQSELI